MKVIPPAEPGLQVVMRVSQGHRREFIQTLERLHEMVVGETGRVACEVLEDSMVPNRFMWVEWWPTSSDVETSLRSERLATLLAAARLLGSVERVRRIRATDAGAGKAPRATDYENGGFEDRQSNTKF